MTPIGTLVADSNYLRYAKVHLPTGKSSTSLFEPLKDPIDIIDMFQTKWQIAGFSLITS